MKIYQLESLPEILVMTTYQLDRVPKFFFFTFHKLEQHQHQHLTHIYVSWQTVPQVYKQHPEETSTDKKSDRNSHIC